MTSRSRSAVLCLTLLVAVLACVLYQYSDSDDRLEFPVCYTHFIVPLRRILPRIVSTYSTKLTITSKVKTEIYKVLISANGYVRHPVVGQMTLFWLMRDRT